MTCCPMQACTALVPGPDVTAIAGLLARCDSHCRLVVTAMAVGHMLCPLMLIVQSSRLVDCGQAALICMQALADITVCQQQLDRLYSNHSVHIQSTQSCNAASCPALDCLSSTTSGNHADNACCRASKRLLLLDYDGTLVDQTAIDNKPDAEVLKMVQGLCADPNNFVFIISGRARTELSQWFDPSVTLSRTRSCCCESHL